MQLPIRDQIVGNPFRLQPVKTDGYLPVMPQPRSMLIVIRKYPGRTFSMGGASYVADAGAVRMEIICRKAKLRCTIGL